MCGLTPVGAGRDRDGRARERAHSMRVEPFLQALTRWVAARADVVAVGMIGSYARGAARVDSDVDVVILSTRAAAMLEEDWPSVFGEVQSRTIEDYGALRSVRVFLSTWT